MVYGARLVGASYREAGAMIGVSYQRARQIVWKMEVAVGDRVPESDAWFNGPAFAAKVRAQYQQWRDKEYGGQTVQ